MSASHTPTRKARRPPRDQEESVFSHILNAVVRRVPGAFAAALVDHDGECVDYAGSVDPFDVKVAGAHWRIAVEDILRVATFDKLEMIICRGVTQSFIVRVMPERYALVVLLTKRAGFASCARALDACERAIAHEAAWVLPKGRGVWIGVDVETDERGRPTWLTMGTLSCAVEVLGTIASPPSPSPHLGSGGGGGGSGASSKRLRGRERGYRVRLPSGGELNLVRESGDKWYADENLG